MAEEQELALMLTVARDALRRVSSGSSERNAVAQSLPRNRHQAGLMKDALTLVLRTVSHQDSLDDLIRRVFPDRKFRIETQCLLRLVAQQIVTHRTIEIQIRRLEHNLRNIVAPELIPLVEVMLGTLLGMEKKASLTELSDVDRIAIETHHPSWWVEYCIKLFGRGEALELLWNPSRKRYIRVNSLRSRGSTSLPKSLFDWGSLLQKTAEKAIYVLKVAPSNLSNYFSKGLFQFQDLASFLAVKAGDPRPMEKVLDLCAAPGAKTSAAAQLMRNRGRIVSVDYSHRRMQTWKRETERLGVTIAEPIIADVTDLSMSEKFDLVIVDPPCTGTGVLDRNPRMKWQLSEKSLHRLASLQRQMLESVAAMVAPSGRILYSTCSITEEENELVVSEFLKRHPEFETASTHIEPGSPGLRGFSDCRRFYPHRDRTAGYFIARMDRLT